MIEVNLLLRAAGPVRVETITNGGKPHLETIEPEGDISSLSAVKQIIIRAHWADLDVMVRWKANLAALTAQETVAATENARLQAAAEQEFSDRIAVEVREQLAVRGN